MVIPSKASGGAYPLAAKIFHWGKNQNTATTCFYPKLISYGTHDWESNIGPHSASHRITYVQITNKPDVHFLTYTQYWYNNCYVLASLSFCLRPFLRQYRMQYAKSMAVPEPNYQILEWKKSPRSQVDCGWWLVTVVGEFYWIIFARIPNFYGLKKFQVIRVTRRYWESDLYSRYICNM